jgi:16S rRNA (adenine1518-N6/adenine1519-N6)-dimethyltransferase
MPDASFHPKKSLGQNFLVDDTYLARIVGAADLAPTDCVLEIGPGQGVLTQALAAQAARIVAVELDDRLIAPLQARFAAQPQVQIVHGDILELEPGALMAQPGAPSAYKVVANLPYYITSAVLRHLLETASPPSLAIVLVQWEVAQRICAEPGDLSLLAVSVQYYARPQLVSRVPAGAFRPVPKVDSAIMRLDVLPTPAVQTPPAGFFAVVRAGFGQRRKQLANSLTAGLSLSKERIIAALLAAGIAPTRRAETLSLAEWDRLCQVLGEGVTLVA